MPVIQVSLDGSALRSYGCDVPFSMQQLFSQLRMRIEQDTTVIVNGVTVLSLYQNIAPERPLREVLIPNDANVVIYTDGDPNQPRAFRIGDLPLSVGMRLNQHRTYRRSQPLPDTFGVEPLDVQDTATQDGITLVIGGGLAVFPNPGSEPRTVVLSPTRIVGVVAEGADLLARVTEWWTNVKAQWSALPEIVATYQVTELEYLHEAFLASLTESYSHFEERETAWRRASSEEESRRLQLVERIDVQRAEQLARTHRLGPDEAQRTIDSLLVMSKILDVQIEGTVVYVRTARLTCPNRRDNSIREMGAYVIRIDCDNDDGPAHQVRWRNITRTVNDTDHPHIHEGSACLGNMYEMLLPLLRQRNIPAIVSMAIQYVENADPEDGWGQGIMHWPLAETPAAWEAEGRSRRRMFGVAVGTNILSSFFQ